MQDVIRDNHAGSAGEHLNLAKLQEKYTRCLFKFTRRFKHVEPETMCRVWNSKAGHLPQVSNKTHVKLANQENVFDVPWDAIQMVE